MAEMGVGGQRNLPLRQKPEIKPVLLGALLFVLGIWTENVCGEDNMSCASVRYTYRDKGFNIREVPKDPVSGQNLRVCLQGLTCCTKEMEHQLSAQSRQEFDKVVQDTVSKLTSLLKVRAQRFDEFFKELLAESKKDFHDMFKRTYGVLYEQNSYVFTDLFEELERYYVKGQVDLEDAMENFFNTLYQKMFTVLNAQYHFDDRYLVCVSEHMKELKPFGDVPHKLSLQVKRSFVATRTFSQALTVASEVVSKVASINPSPDCARALMKMTYCGACQGLPDLKACNNYCINVMKGCLAYQVELDTEWNNFVDALIDVAERLLGPFNIEMVVEPINIKISEAIMNFQENGMEVSQKVFNGCGKPRLGRRDVTELEFETLQFGRTKAEDFPSVNRIVKEIKQRVKVTKRFWSHLPYQVCNNEKVAAGPSEDNENCWNGLKKARYEVQIIGDGMSNQQNNPEVQVDVSRQNSLLNEQIFTLKTITNKLKNAYNGMDVEWIDYEDSAYGSGSGSGDGDDVESSGDGSDIDFGDTRKKDADVVLLNATVRPEVDRPSTATGGKEGTTTRPTMSITRAVTTYLFPIVVVWFGGMFPDWLR